MDNPTIEQLSEEDLNKLIKSATSKNLAGYVIVYRMFKLYKDIAAKCMQELMIRRESGDEFDFEKYIKDEVSAAPKSKINDLSTLRQILKNT